KEERRKAIDFSDQYYDSGLAAMVQANNTTIKSIDELNGKVIAAKTGTATIDWIKAHLNPKEIRQFPNIDQSYLALEAGR
ncbi:transporter substrate-binding domain-containing protein, partial [Burkholderia pseudomallei]